MNTIITTIPTNKQKESVQALISTCNSYEALTLSYPYDDTDTLHLYAYEGEDMVSALVLCHIDDCSYECVGWTMPQSRQKGYIHTLLCQATDYLHEHGVSSIHISFILDGHCDASVSVMSSIGAVLSDRELKMSAELSQIGILLGDDIEIIGSDENYYDISLSGSHVGSYYIRPMESGRVAYLYGFSIDEALRGQGIGTLVFSGIVSELKKQGYLVLSLQVSEQNIPAVSIYTSYGLTSDEAISYYIKTF